MSKPPLPPLPTEPLTGIYRHWKHGELYVITSQDRPFYNEEDGKVHVRYIHVMTGLPFGRSLELFLGTVDDGDSYVGPRFRKLTLDEMADLDYETWCRLTCFELTP